ncbi:SIMPL domain-containing protein [Candidatus Woesearchaeota archaeon]|nr:SIMPL domain-containing protein [Candidatus Woesearchaeota archaeon]
MKKESLWLISILVVGLSLTAIILAAGSKSTSTTEVRNTLASSGNSELTVAPDKAELYLKIETLEDTAADSRNANAEITDDVIKTLKKKGVSADDIETSRFDLYKKEIWNRNTNLMDFQGYQLTHVLKVTTEKLDNVGSLIDTAVDAGANGIERVSYGLTKDKEKEVRSEALVKASELAEEKAETLAASLKVRLISIATVTESSFYYSPYEYYPKAMAEVDEAVAGSSVQPQNVDISATVNIVYEIK